jgi:hypothetical protein
VHDHCYKECIPKDPDHPKKIDCTKCRVRETLPVEATEADKYGPVSGW